MARFKRVPLQPNVILVAAIAFGLGIFFEISWLHFFPVSNAEYVQTDSSIRQEGAYKLVSPLLACATYQSTDSKEQVVLKNDLNNLVQSKISAREATNISVYFRGFSGQWVGIGENELYSPASILKVPIMIAYFKEAEADPSILDKTIRYTGANDENTNEYFKSGEDLAPGTYTVDELIKAMIVNSDNNAEHLLTLNIDQKYLDDVYTDLGLRLPTEATSVDFISPKQLSYFFRVLYNATYISPEYSEKALELLSASTFTQGMRSAVPAGMSVADKFGERTIQNQSGTILERELHDCGLIYTASGKPYLLCIMTRGNDFSKLLDVIASVTKLVTSEASAN
jgi:beta-lactamase class A